MPVQNIARWKIDSETALSLGKEYATLAKEAGAQQVRFGVQHSGHQPGSVYIITTYNNFAEMGKAQDTLQANSTYQKILGQARDKGEMLDRVVIITSDLT